jgi:hypothetical protein
VHIRTQTLTVHIRKYIIWRNFDLLIVGGTAVHLLAVTAPTLHVLTSFGCPHNNLTSGSALPLSLLGRRWHLFLYLIVSLQNLSFASVSFFKTCIKVTTHEQYNNHSHYISLYINIL